ncbi:MAG: hypothetical protein JRH11_17270 [Deltaproteobacteria bacterium]|nr:hypothetical protein [Deltaproteobacteria bacterium]
MLGFVSACGEQRVVLFDASALTGPDSGPVDGGPDVVALDASGRDPERCGPASIHCEDDEYCVDGLCVCREELTRIGEDCVHTNANASHCGGAGVTCPELCADGECVSSCPSDTTDCDGGCVDTGTHPLHCGECGRRCGSDRVCIDGDCTPFRPASCISCPCDLCGTRTCCEYPGTTDPICVDGPACAGDVSTEESET